MHQAAAKMSTMVFLCRAAEQCTQPAAGSPADYHPGQGSEDDHLLVHEHLLRSSDENNQIVQYPLSWEDLKSAWFLNPDSCRSVPIQVPSRAHLTTDMIRGLLYKTKDWLSEWIRTGSNGFIHAELYKDSLPEVICDAFTSLAAYMSRTEQTAEIVLRMMESKADKLVESVGAVEDRTSTLESLSRVHTLLVYCTIRLLDGDLRQRHKAEQHLQILHSWTCKMISDTSQAMLSGDIILHNHLTNRDPQYFTFPLLLGQFSPEELLWHAWILSESAFGDITSPVVPLCDGAGQIECVGSSVTKFKPGDRVITFPAPDVVSERGSDADTSMADVPTMLGIGTHGTLRTHGVFSENALVHAPASLDWRQASTLPVTWLTAWNALSQLKDRKMDPHTWILVQGTGGVSIATLQLAVSLGLTVVATTSTSDKAAKLKALGASHVVNYRQNPNSWGKEAKSLTPNGLGFDLIVDIGGNDTLGHCLEAVRPYGSIQVVGAVGKEAAVVPMMGALMSTCTIRGFLMDTQKQYEAFVQYIDEKRVQPVYDEAVYELAEAKEAYRRLKEQKHFAKVVIRIE
ncbi:hypothetical protein FLONG3_5168 [Fusarium longipes]|uniref:Enoyl reductase (ER) domain-containing protein n=1 Tax=Fusarium longipes TaxID=694270 RepID=A0A395SW68_9HYPO|nr:hypothetical protein FLONG3_5168 [Fusarium longipes]